MTARTALLFPGQGAYLPGVLSEWTDDFPQLHELLATVDDTAAAYGNEPVSKLLLDPAGAPLDELLETKPELVDLTIYATNCAAYEILVGLGLRIDVLAGHSFGELAALTSTGAVTPKDATKIVCERAAAFRAVAPPAGGMTALALDSRRARHLVGLLDDPLISIAVDNGPEQNVVAGPVASLEEAEQMAGAIGVRATRLRAAFAFHNPLLHTVTRAFTEAVSEIVLQRPRIPVYSATLGRYLTDTSEVRTLVDQHMVLPVRFYDGLLSLFHDGVRTFVEAGARQALTRLVHQCLPSSAAAAPLLPRRGSAHDLSEALRQAGIPVAVELPASARTPVSTPGPPPDMARSSVRAETPDSSPIASPSTSRPEPVVEAGALTAAPAKQNGLPSTPQLILELRALYAEQLGYPQELVTEDIDLEADLGIDSIKQIEVFADARQHFGLPQPPPDLRVTTTTTLEGIADLLTRIADAGIPNEE